MQRALPATDSAPSWSPSLQALIARGVPKRHRKGTILIQEGDHGDALFIVLSGKVKAYSTDERDREIVYGVYGPGEYLGEMSLDGEPRSASVITLTPTTCVMVTRTSLQEHIAAHPAFAFELLSRVIRRARLATQSARSMALLSVYARIKQLLESMAEPISDTVQCVKEPLTHREIAAHVGCSREMVSRIMKDLSAGGYVRQGKAGLEILKVMPSAW